MELTAAVTVRKSQQDVYDFWRRFDRLASFMAHVESVEVLDEKRSRWRATAPFGKAVEWNATITDDVPGERIAWRSDEDADVRNEGSVRFFSAPGDQGTEIAVAIRYDIPGGALGSLVARYFGEEPHQHLDDDLRRFKQIIETGEIARSDGAPSGKKSREEFPQHPAQPLSDEEYVEIEREVVSA